MVEGPEPKESVFVRCLADTWRGGDGDEDGLNMKRGGVWVVRWEDVKTGVLDGSLELL